MAERDLAALVVDDVDADAAGLQVEVAVVVENGDVAEVTLTSTATSSAPVANGRAVLRADLDVAIDGADNVLVATAGELQATRTVLGVDATPTPVATPPGCAISVDGAGVAVVSRSAAIPRAPPSRARCAGG